MSINIIHDTDNGIAALYCSTTDWTLFAPVFSDCDKCPDTAFDLAQQFLAFANRETSVDLRLISPTDMAAEEGKFLQYHANARHDHTSYCEECGTVEIDGHCRCG